MEGVRDAGEAFGEALRRLRSRYSLYLGLPEGPPGKEHKIRVELSKQAQQANPGARARSRAGYIMPGPRNPAARCFALDERWSRPGSRPTRSRWQIPRLASKPFLPHYRQCG